MYYGIDLPNYGTFSDLALLMELAQEAEQAGWDGFFLWDHISLGQYPIPIVDPWIALAAIAVKTENIRLGPMVTPLSRRRPWQVARETVALDHLSHGRLIFGAGSGAGFAWDGLGESTDAKERAALLDEGLEVLTGLWKGEQYSYTGKHYQIKETVFVPGPLQTPRIPIWIAGIWPNKPPFRRAARWDGVIASGGDWNTKLTPDMVRNMISYIQTYRTDDAPLDVVVRGERTMEASDRSIITAYEAAGGTWWFENVLFGEEPDWSIAAARSRIRNGPPRD